MNYELLVLDLDGTLTNSEKKITKATKEAILQIQKNGKKIALASGRPTQGVLPLAKELSLAEYGGYVLSYNGGHVIDCKHDELIYSKILPPNTISPIFNIVQKYDVDIITYDQNNIISGHKVNTYTHLESKINSMPIQSVDDFVSFVDFPINKLLIIGDPEIIALIEIETKNAFHESLNIFRSEPFFLEIMPQNIDKAYSLEQLLSTINLTAEQMICCGDGYNDMSMIEYAGLGIAMANAQPAVLACADYITKSNDEDGVLHVINTFLT